MASDRWTHKSAFQESIPDSLGYVEFRISEVEVEIFTSGGRRSLCMSGRDSLPSNHSVN